MMAILAIIFFVCLDRFLKILAVSHAWRRHNLIGEIFKFSYQPNYHIAFSLPLGGRLLEVVIFLIILSVMAAGLDCLRKQEASKLAPLALIVLGASSNLYDRLKFGFVVDYLDLKYFTVFNLADAMIVAGVIFLIIFSYKKRKNAQH